MHLYYKWYHLQPRDPIKRIDAIFTILLKFAYSNNNITYLCNGKIRTACLWIICMFANTTHTHTHTDRPYFVPTNDNKCIFPALLSSLIWWHIFLAWLSTSISAFQFEYVGYKVTHFTLYAYFRWSEWSSIRNDIM